MATQWWRDFLVELDPARAVSVTASGGDTKIIVEDRIPHLRQRGLNRPRYRVTTEGHFLSPALFPHTVARHAIALDAAKGRNRALFCLDVSSYEVLAACSFHVDEKPSVRLTLCDLAIRQDGAAANGWSVFGAHILMGYLFEIAKQTKRLEPDTLEFLARNSDEEQHARALGFRRCSGTGSVRGAHNPMCLDKPS